MAARSIQRVVGWGLRTGGNINKRVELDGQTGFMNKCKYENREEEGEELPTLGLGSHVFVGVCLCPQFLRRLEVF